MNGQYGGPRYPVTGSTTARHKLRLEYLAGKSRSEAAEGEDPLAQQKCSVGPVLTDLSPIRMRSGDIVPLLQIQLVGLPFGGGRR